MRRSRNASSCVIWLLSVGLISGCATSEWNYMFSVAGGELDLLLSGVPIEVAVEDPTLTDEEQAKVELIIAARDYAHDVMGLNVGSSYQNFVNLHGESLAWNLTASAKDAIQPYLWNLPFIGNLSYLGYFEKDQAIAERDRLVNEGYDTFIYEVDAFSTVGLLPDPATSALLKRDEASLADTVTHELLHNTIWRGDQPNFSESLAVFVGRTGGLEFLSQYYGADAPLLQTAREHYEDHDKFNVFLVDLTSRLNALYGSELSRDEKIAQRTVIFEEARQRLADELLPTLHDPERYRYFTTVALNNAYLLVNTRYYSRLDLYAEVFEIAGRNWAQALDIYRQAAAVPNPVAFLQTYVQQHPLPD